jgi:hypothetical protein
LRQEFTYTRIAGEQDIDLPAATKELGDIAGDESEGLFRDAVAGGCRRAAGSCNGAGLARRGLVYRW